MADNRSWTKPHARQLGGSATWQAWWWGELRRAVTWNPRRRSRWCSPAG